MRNETDLDFAMERRLRQLSPELHRRFADAVYVLPDMLNRYKRIFPEYTDHSILHSITVADFCNRLAGSRIGQLNADELYTLLMGCYLHDTGMGISMKDYAEFSAGLDFGDYFDTHSRDDYVSIIRDFHHEYSGCFIRKYAELFEIPSEAHVQAVVQVARGHRKTDLMDEREYPAAFPMPDGNTVCLPYLAALIRLADEIDVAAARNPILLYDIETLTDDIQIIENKKVKAVEDLRMTGSSFVMTVEDADPDILAHLRRMAVKMQTTLETCRKAVCGRTPYMITQHEVVLEAVNDKLLP